MRRDGVCLAARYGLSQGKLEAGSNLHEADGVGSLSWKFPYGPSMYQYQYDSSSPVRPKLSIPGMAQEAAAEAYRRHEMICFGGGLSEHL